MLYAVKENQYRVSVIYCLDGQDWKYALICIQHNGGCQYRVFLSTVRILCNKTTHYRCLLKA